MKALVAGIALVLLANSTVLAQDTQTVESLLKAGYEIKGVIPSNAGPGILLQQGTDLVMCFVAETPDSAEITTQYCKPVK